MPRTSASDVQSLLGGDYKSSASLIMPMRMAAKMVDNVNTCAGDKDVTLDATELELLECLLTAHYYCVSDRVYTNRSTVDSSGGFAFQPGEGLKATPYGQQALDFDRSGCLKNIALQQFAGGFWLGKTPDEQIPYEDR